MRVKVFARALRRFEIVVIFLAEIRIFIRRAVQKMDFECLGFRVVVILFQIA